MKSLLFPNNNFFILFDKETAALQRQFGEETDDRKIYRFFR